MSFDTGITVKPSIKQIIINQEIKVMKNEIMRTHTMQRYELVDLLDHIRRQQNLIDSMSHMIDNANLAFSCNDCVLLNECTLNEKEETCQLKMIMEEL